MENTGLYLGQIFRTNGVRIIEGLLNSFVNLTALRSVYFYYTGKLTRFIIFWWSLTIDVTYFLKDNFTQAHQQLYSE